MSSPALYGMLVDMIRYYCIQAVPGQYYYCSRLPYSPVGDHLGLRWPLSSSCQHNFIKDWFIKEMYMGIKHSSTDLYICMQRVANSSDKTLLIKTRTPNFFKTIRFLFTDMVGIIFLVDLCLHVNLDDIALLDIFN